MKSQENRTLIRLANSMQDSSSNPLRHCFISWANVHAGSNTAHYEYANELSQLGYDVTLIARGEGPPYWRRDNFLIVPVTSTRYGEKLSHLAFVWTVIAYLRRRQFDFVNVYLCPGVSVYPILFFWKRTNWILHIRTSNTSPGWHGLIKNLVGRLESLVYDFITIIDRGIANNLFFGRKAANALIELPLGVSPVAFGDRRAAKAQNLLGNRCGELTLVYVGRMDRTRQLRVMLEAYRLVYSEHPSMVLVMVGDGDDRKSLEEFSKDRGFARGVIFVGAVDYYSVADYMAIADIALTYIPVTKMYDSQPALKVLEYLQMGLPQVATMTEANRKFIVDGRNGILVSSDAVGFASGIRRLVTDQRLREGISERCSKTLEQHYWHKIAEKVLVPFYEKILSGE